MYSISLFAYNLHVFAYFPHFCIFRLTAKCECGVEAPLKLFTPKCQVFDGHGDQGKKMSHFAKQALDLWHLRVYLGVYIYKSTSY